MEQGVLGCILIDPIECMGSCIAKLKADSFYDLRNQTIWGGLVAMYQARKPIDVITLQQHLKDKQLLEQVGGITYLSSLPDVVPSAANLSYYLTSVIEKATLRKMIHICTDAVSRVYDWEGDVDELIDSLDHDVTELSRSKTNSLSESSHWADLLNFDTENDPNNIIGLHNGKTTRYLCRGHGAWLIGPSGVGKSSLMLQFGISFAAGLSLWGVAPMRPYRVLVVQAENDKGDIAEMAKGIEAGLNIDALQGGDSLYERVNQNLKVVSVSGIIGQQFCGWLEREIISFNADIVLVDPLLSFAGIDVSRTDQASQFCRVWLDPVLRRTGAVLISVHHTGKPKEQRNGKAVESIYDQMYSGLGSSELVNWARAVMLLQPVGDDAFKLVFAKRGKRAWATHPNEQPTQIIWLRHAKDGKIFWEQIEPPEEVQEQREAKEKPLTKPQMIATSNLGTFLSKCPKEGEGLRAMVRRLKNWLGSKDSPKRSLSSCGDGTIRSAIGLMLENDKLAMDNSVYFKGPQA